ncbi:hypothetical protein JZO78_09510 [Enterococcus ureilyticus]|uniref:hypothetical protein n=1 Tax=Enterococcus ureilyticus TaxID=1131292 RepID=UPI001A939F52|nr:hypothetical protein [Enterococcus ureilyticus]MBO0446582.1 hypothetical protein [Enterococcus ureilyticus]
MGNKEPEYKFLRILLRLGWYATFACQAIMVILWISSFLSRDSSLFFKSNLITGILIFLLNYFLLKGAWSEVNGTNGFSKIYIVTGVLMVINVICLSVGIFYILIPIYMQYQQKEQLKNEIQKKLMQEEQEEEGEF